MPNPVPAMQLQPQECIVEPGAQIANPIMENVQKQMPRTQTQCAERLMEVLHVLRKEVPREVLRCSARTNSW